MGLLPLFMLAHFGHHLVTALPIPLLPMIRSEFALDYAQSGLLISAFTLCYGISQIPAGWLADRIGPRVLITIGLCGVALAGLLVGLSQGYLMTALFFAFMGIAGGGYHPAAPPLISAAVAPQKRGQAMGLHMVAGSTPYFLAPLMAVAIAGLWGWQGTFVALAVPTFVFGIILYIFLGRLPERKQTQPPSEKQPSQGHVSKGRFRPLFAFVFLSSFTHAVTFSTVTFVPLFIIDRFGIEKETAATFLSIFYSAGLWASLMGGALSDRIGRVPVLLGVCFLAGPLIALFPHLGYPFGIAGLLLGLGITLYVRTPVTEAYIVGQTAGRHGSTVLGVYYFANIDGVGILTPLIGFCIDRFGFDATLTVSGIIVVALTLVCSFFLKERNLGKD